MMLELERKGVFWTILVLGIVTRIPPYVHSVCSQFIAISSVSSSGNITSPGFPSPYPPDAHCQYKLQGEEWQGIKITFLQFDLEPRYTAGCLNDYLEINTVDVKGQRMFMGRFCGITLPQSILVLHPTMELVFRSNHAVHSTGFVAEYEFLDEKEVTTPRLNATSPCGEVVQGIGGTVVSPGFPKGYAAGLDCLWLIRVKYGHAIYVRVQHLEFQGSTANCQKAQLRIYDGYEHSLEDHTVLKKFCGDTRFYKGDDEKVLLSNRNRLLIRFTTTEPSKPVNDSEANVGFRLVWSDVEFDTAANCTKSSRFPCKEAQICFTNHHKGGTSSCPDLRHYCISKELVCDGTAHCGETDSSDERNCYQAPMMVIVVAAPLTVLSCGLFICFCWFSRSNHRRERDRRRRSINAAAAVSVSDTTNNGLVGMKRDKNGGNGRTGAGGGREGGGGSCCDCCCISSSESATDLGSKSQKMKEDLGKQHHRLTCHTINNGNTGNRQGGGREEEDGDGNSFRIQNSNAPITRGPIFFKNDLESPGASDIVSPASGFSDSESDLGSQIPIYCPAHGPIPLIPMRYLNRHHFPLLPAVQEQTYHSDTYDEGGSTYSSGQNSDQMIICSSTNPLLLHPSGGNNSSSEKIANSTGLVNEWRLRRGVQRSDAIYISDDGKSSVASSPGRICPRCLEKEQRESSGGNPGGGIVRQPSSDSKSVIAVLNVNNDSGGANLKNLEGHNNIDVGVGGSPGMQFDSGIIDCSQMGDCGSVTGGGGGGGMSNPVKNVSFETCTSSDSAISTKGGRSVSWNKPCTVSILPCSNRFKQNVIEEVTSQSNQSQTNSNSASSSVASNIGGGGCGNGGGGEACVQHHHHHRHATSQGIQTDLPSPPPSIISQDENNCMGELELEDPHNHHLLPPCCRESLREGNNNIGGGSGGVGARGGRQSSSFCVTVTTFGVTPSGAGGSGNQTGAGAGSCPGGSSNPSNLPTTAKATDV